MLQVEILSRLTTYSVCFFVTAFTDSFYQDKDMCMKKNVQIAINNDINENPLVVESPQQKIELWVEFAGSNSLGRTFCWKREAKSVLYKDVPKKSSDYSFFGT